MSLYSAENKEELKLQDKLREIQGQITQISSDSIQERLSAKDISLRINECISNELISLNKIITSYDNGQLFIWTGKFFKQAKESYVEEQIQFILPRTSTHQVNEIVDMIKRKSRQEREIFESQNINLINFNNCIFDYSTQNIIPHDPKYHFNFIFPYDFNPSAKCPHIHKFIKEILPQDKVKTAYEFIAYCMRRDSILQKSLLLVGGGWNGKTTFINLISKLFGNENITNIPLQEFEIKEFRTCELYGKHINFFDDLSPEAMTSTGVFKTITGGGRITANKKFKDMFGFTAFAKLIFASNLPPKTEDDSDAFYRRWLILPFDKQFIGEKDNKNLFNEITTKEEIEGLIACCTAILPNLIKRGRFNYNPPIEEIRSNYTSLSDPVESFCEKKLIFNGGSAIPKGMLYAKFLKYCDEKHYPHLSDKAFYKGIIKNFNVNEETRNYLGKKIRFWVGIEYIAKNEEDKITLKYEDTEEKIVYEEFR